MRNKLLLLSSVLILLWRIPASGQTADDFFDARILHEIRLSIHPADWQSLKTHYQENIHYGADFHWIFRGKDILAEQVSVRSRGLGSRSGVKPGITVAFDRFTDRPFLGLKTVVLRNNTQDPSMLRERVAMAFINLMGMPAPREAHARLYVNGRYSGLYSIVEDVDTAFLQRVFGQNRGYLYKYVWAFTWFFEYLGADPALYSPALLNPETQEAAPDPSPLERMIRTINQTPDPYFMDEVSRYLDLKQFVTYIAIDNFLAEGDGLIGLFGANNFYVYRFENTELSQFLFWDKSMSFSSVEWPILGVTESNVLARRALAVPELHALYVDTLLRAADLAGGPGGWMEQEIRREYNQVREAAIEDSLKQCYLPGNVTLGSCSNAAFENDVAFLIRFAGQRAANVRQQLAGSVK